MGEGRGGSSLYLKIKRVYYACTCTHKQKCRRGVWNNRFFGWMTKTSLRVDAWQALISSLPLRLPLSYHRFSHSSFLLRSVCRCSRPQSRVLTPVSETIAMYDKHKSPLFYPCPTFTPSRRDGIKERFKADTRLAMGRQKSGAGFADQYWPAVSQEQHWWTGR